jgi:parallel beta-helix repeat protein
VVGIILLFLGSSIPAFAYSNVTSTLPFPSGNTLYVGGSGPGNYTKIQDAINAASNGDTVFVFDDSSPYYEHLNITKSIALIGENKETTLINGSHTGTVINLLANNVTISGFTVEDSGFITLDSGIFCNEPYFDHLRICNNIIRKSHYGLYIHYATNVTLVSNDLVDNQFGIWVYGCRDWNVSGNLIEGSQGGFEADDDASGLNKTF